MTTESLKLLIEEQDLHGVIEYLSNGGDANCVTSFRTTPLFHAIYCDCLVESNIFNYDIDKMPSFRVNEIILHLIRAGADVHARKDKNMTPLLYALSLRRGYKVIQELINAGSHINAKSLSDMTPLMFAIQGNYDKALIKNILRSGANTNDRDCLGKTPLFYALRRNDSFEIVSLLLDYEADVNLCTNKYSTILAEVGCKSCSEDNCKNKQTIDLILRSGLKLKKKDGKSFIHETNCNYLIRLYIDHGVSVDTVGLFGSAPLMCAANCKNVEKVKSLLVLFDADPNCLDIELRTAFHYIYEMIDVYDVIKLLLYHGGDLYLRDNHGVSGLDAMLDKGDRPVSWSTAPSLQAIIKHIVLFDDENVLNDSFSNYRCSYAKKLLFQFMEDCRIELSRMRSTLIKENLSFYQFCLLKKCYKSKYLVISVDDYYYNFEQIKILFPIYQDFIVTRIKDNQVEHIKRVLRRGLESIIISPLTVSENDNDVQLVSDCNYLIAHNFNRQQLYNLFLASTEP